MDKKQRITWGVSFGSLALVAGMTAYLGLGSGNGNISQTVMNQNPQSGYFSNQEQSSGQANDQSFGRHRFDSNNGNFDQSSGWSPSEGNSGQNFGDDSSNFDQSFGDDSTNNNFDQGFGDSNGQEQFSNGGFGGGHHGGFDTTTGGT